MALDLISSTTWAIYRATQPNTASYEWRIGIGKQGIYTMEELLGASSGDGSIIRVFFSGIRSVYQASFWAAQREIQRRDDIK